ncbi:hypothetical protein Pmani_006920 [Petrolisthes manimaculis]|uniref:Uncharacterized protein n=1 Tax=Petrolisthes manimaculis TaxID=1843537 RepID=A0AAE1UKM7_9EUCA|nr:hypothetical protein Pmani_006920 [Petrolisthes manimaculis]
MPLRGRKIKGNTPSHLPNPKYSPPPLTTITTPFPPHPSTDQPSPPQYRPLHPPPPDTTLSYPLQTAPHNTVSTPPGQKTQKSDTTSFLLSSQRVSPPSLPFIPTQPSPPPRSASLSHVLSTESDSPLTTSHSHSSSYTRLFPFLTS